MDPFSIAILCYIGAVLLVFIDLFIPSGGMLAVLAVLAALASVLFGFRSSTNVGLAMMAMVFFSVPILVLLAIKIWPNTPIGKRVVLKTPQQQELREDPVVGKVVVTESTLMPTGQIKYGHRRLNAIAQSGIIESGERVKVVELKNRDYVVVPTNEALSAEPTLDPELASSDQAVAASTGQPYDLLDIPAKDLGLDSIDSVNSSPKSEDL